MKQTGSRALLKGHRQEAMHFQEARHNYCDKCLPDEEITSDCYQTPGNKGGMKTNFNNWVKMGSFYNEY